MSGIPVIAGGAAIDCKPSVIVGGVEVPIYDGYVIQGGQAIKIYQSAIPYTVSGVGTSTVTATFAEPVLVNLTDGISAYGHGKTNYTGSWDMRCSINMYFSDSANVDISENGDDAEAGAGSTFGSVLTAPKHLTRVTASVHFIDAPTGTEILDDLEVGINGKNYSLMQDGEIEVI